MKVYFLLLFLLLSCAKGEKVNFVSVKKDLFAKFINDKDLPSKPNLSVDKNIVNNTYPIEIALYKDKKFYYDLPNLGDGTGTWIYKDGRIELRAHRDIFDMYIEVYALDDKASELAITFVDRFGHNTIKMLNNNLP